MNPTLTYRLAARTDIGLKRSVNEDNFGVFEIPGTDAAFVVCDGMGGLKAGDIASSEATKAIGASLTESLAAGDEPTAALGRALRRANEAVCRLPRPGGGSGDDPTIRPGSAASGSSNAVIGTTAVAGIVKGGQLHLGHAGDSRAYRLRGERLERLTDDHSFVAEQVRAGNMTEAEARKSRFRNMITRAVGIDPVIQPELRSLELAPGDLILICSDGLTTLIEDPEIEEHLLSPKFQRSGLEQQVQSLIDSANRAGGTDNTTILLLRVFGEGDAPAQSATAIGPAPERRDPSALLTQDVDASAPRNKRRAALSPLTTLLAVAGGATLLALGALLALPGARQAVGFNLLQMNGLKPERLLATPEPPPLQEDMTYDKPVELARAEIARGDVLHYQPGKGIYFVTKSTGQGRWLSKTGSVIGKSAAPTLPELPLSDDVLKARTFTATDALGNLYVSRPALKKIEKYDPRGGLRLTITGLERPEALAVDEQGTLYVVDFNAIKVISARSKLIGPAPKKPAAPQ